MTNPFRYIGRLFRSQLYKLDKGDPALVAMFGGGTRNGSGVTVNERAMLSASAIFACVRNISEDCAKLPLKIYRAMEPRGRQLVSSHPAYKLLDSSPNEEMTAFDFRQAMTACAILYGRGIAEIEWMGNGKPGALWPIEPWRVAISRELKGQERLLYSIDGREVAARDILHIKGFNIDGLIGEMLARVGEDSIGLGLAAQKFAASFFGGGARPAIILTHPGKLSIEGQKQMVKAFDEGQSGPDQGNRTKAVAEDVKVNKLSWNAQESQAVESRQFSVEDLCRWFRMPPHKVGHLLRAHGWSTLESTNTDYVIDTLTPWLVRWEQEIDRRLLSGGLYARHIVQALMRGDSGARGTYYRTLREIGVLNANDIRDLEDLNPIGPEGEVYYIASNLQPLSNNDAGAIAFKREVVKALLVRQAAGDVIFNASDLVQLMGGAGVPVKDKPPTPLLPIVAVAGPLVSGATIYDPAGAVVGGDVEVEPPPEPPATSIPPPAAPDPQGTP